MLGMTPALIQRRCGAAMVIALLSTACVHSVRPPATSQATNVLEVEVTTSADTAARFAYVRAAFDGTPTTVAMVRQPSGRFIATIPPNARRVTLSVSVPEHGVFQTQATLPPERPALFRVRPRPVFARDTITTARVVGDFNQWKARPGDRLLPSPDGHLRVAIPFVGDSVRFQIAGIGVPSNAAWMPTRSYAVAPDSLYEVSFAGYAERDHARPCWSGCDRPSHRHC